MKGAIETESPTVTIEFTRSAITEIISLWNAARIRNTAGHRVELGLREFGDGSAYLSFSLHYEAPSDE